MSGAQIAARCRAVAVSCVEALTWVQKQRSVWELEAPRRNAYLSRAWDRSLPGLGGFSEPGRFASGPDFAPEVPTAVDVQRLAGDESGGGAGEEQGGLGDFPRCSGTTQGVGLGITRPDLG